MEGWVVSARVLETAEAVAFHGKVIRHIDTGMEN
jgi:hypothetical protein